jgi:hypothetical protein
MGSTLLLSRCATAEAACPKTHTAGMSHPSAASILGRFFFYATLSIYMQKLATRIFIYASVAFGIIGLLIVLTSSGPDTPDTKLDEALIRLLFATVFIILPSFALSVASTYLNGQK